MQEGRDLRTGPIRHLDRQLDRLGDLSGRGGERRGVVRVRECLSPDRLGDLSGRGGAGRGVVRVRECLSPDRLGSLS